MNLFTRWAKNRKIQKQNSLLLGNPAFLEEIAFHEAGHIVIALHVGVAFGRATILVDHEHGKPGLDLLYKPSLDEIRMMPVRDRFQFLRPYIMIAQAGPLAQEKHAGNPRFMNGKTDDEIVHYLTDIGNCYHASCELSRTTKQLLDYSTMWNQVCLVANSLLESKSVSYTEIVSILGIGANA